MKLFIPEGFIYFYVYSGGPDLLSYFYGTVDNILVDSACFYHGSNIFDGFIFNNNKILWGRAWKSTYFRYEAPFFKHLAINDRFNWAYPFTIYKLVTEWHNAIFVTKFASIKGYSLSMNKQVFLPFTFLPKHVLLNIGDYMYMPVFQGIAMMEGLSRNNGWNHTPYAIFLSDFSVSYLISRIFNGFFTYMFFYIYLLIASIAINHMYNLILIFIPFCFLLLNFRYFIYLERISVFDFEKILNIIDKLNKFIYSYMQQLTNTEGKTSSIFLLFILNLIFYKHYRLIDGYSKFFVVLLSFKQKYFRLNNFLFFVLIYTLKRVYEILFNILNFFFFSIGYILWKFAKFYFPLIFFLSKYSDKYAGVFKYQLNIWFFTYLNYIVSDLRDGSVGSAVLGWIRWTQISAAWDEFVDNEWLKIDKFRSEYIKKKKKKQKFEIEEEMQKADDEIRRKRLKRQGIDDDQIEKTVKYHQEKARQFNKNKEQWIFHEMIQTKKYKKRYEFFKKKLMNKYKPKSRKWSKLYNIFSFNYYKKVFDKYDESLLEMDKEIGYEFIKEMAYYNWLMERKYLLLKKDYSYYDYLEFMNIQEYMLVYYSETAQILTAFSSFFKMVGFFFKTDNLYINYAKFKGSDGLTISSIIKINVVVSRFYYKFFTYENIYFKNFIESLLIFFQLLTFSSYLFFFMYTYILFFVYYFFSFLRLILSSDRILIYPYSYILIFKLKKRSANFVILFDKLNKIFIYIKFVSNFIIKIFLLIISYIKAVYQFFVDAFIDTYYWIKYSLFDIWFYFYLKVHILLTRFKIILIFFILLYFFAGMTPYDLYSAIFGLILKIFFNYGYYFAVKSTIFVSIKDSLFLFFSWDIYQKYDFFHQVYKFFHSSYLNSMYKICIYSYFTPIFDIIGRLLTFPFYLFLSYTPYLSSISHWTWYDFKTLEVLNYLKQQEVLRELIWRSHNFYKTLLGGFLYHPIYRLYKNNHSEWLIISKYLWYSVFTIDYKIRVTYFFARLLSYIVVFPYWALRYGPYYIAWQYHSYGVNSYFLNISLFIVYFEMYIRWHLLGFIVTLFGVLLIYPSMIFLFFFEIINFIIIKFNIYYIPFFFYSIFFCLKNYYDIYNNFWYSINIELLSFFSVSCLFYVEILLNYLFYLNVFSLGTIKVMGHFFQCFIPFVRYFIKYDVMFFFLWIDIFTSIMHIILIVYNIFSIPFYLIFSFFSYIYSYLNFFSIGIIIGDFAEFFYKSILYPYFIVYSDGFFDYYGKYSLFSSGQSAVTINKSLYFTDVKDVYYSKRSYMSAQKRWALVTVDGYNNLYYGFIFRSIAYREIGAATLFFQIYVWYCYILYVFIICFVFSGVNAYLRHKDNVFSDSAYLWYRLTPNNKLINFSRDELFWMTQNKWIFAFNNIKGIFVNDNIKSYKDEEYEEDNELLGRLALKYIEKSVKYGATVGSENDYKRELNYILSYGSFKNQDKFDKYLNDYWKAIRYKRIQKKITSLFEVKVFSRPFASSYFKSFKFELSKNTNVEDLEVVFLSSRFWDYWLNFAMPLLIFSKYGYGSLVKYDKNFDLGNYFKALTLMIMKKDDKFKDLHDFYFLEHDFYENFNDIWLWSKQKKGHLLRSIVGSRHTSKLVYSSRTKLDSRLLDPVFIDNLYDYFGKIIKISDYDSSILNNLVNFRMHNILTSDRVVETQLTAKQIEKRVLEDYTDFMEVGWEQDRMEDGQLAVYKYLSERLYESFMDNEQDSESDEEKIYINTMYNTSNKLSLKTDYTPFPDPWLAFSIVLPILISIHFYKVFILFSYAASHFRPSYMYELCFFFVYLFYYVNTHLFFATICSSLMFYPKLLNRRRRLRTFTTAKILSVVEKFFPNNELFKMLVNFSAVTPVLLFIKPAMDFFIFYIIFIILIVSLFKIIVDVDTH